jgi:hypothetical protein
MSLSASDFKQFIDWYGSSNIFWKRHVLFDLRRVLPDGLTDDRVHYRGEFVCIPSQWYGRSDHKGITFVPGNLHGNGFLVSPYVIYPVPPSVIVYIALKPVTIGLFFIDGEPDIANKLFESAGVEFAAEIPGDFELGFTLPQAQLEYRLNITTSQTNTIDPTHVPPTVPKRTP